jgi:hypothetical protein
MPHAELQLLDAALDGGVADAELAGGLGDVTLALGQQLLQRLCGGLAGGVAGAAQVEAPCSASGPHILGVQHPVAMTFPKDEQLVIQKAFFYTCGSFIFRRWWGPSGAPGRALRRSAKSQPVEPR